MMKYRKINSGLQLSEIYYTYIQFTHRLGLPTPGLERVSLASQSCTQTGQWCDGHRIKMCTNIRSENETLNILGYGYTDASGMDRRAKTHRIYNG